MNFCEFLNRRVKTRVDFDGAYGAQCTDLFRQFCNDVLQIAHTGVVGGAKDLWRKYDELPREKEHFIQVKGNYKPADVIVWDGTKTNPYGHVALVVSVLDGGQVLVFEQDGFKQEGAKFAVRDANAALGALRAKKLGEGANG